MSENRNLEIIGELKNNFLKEKKDINNRIVEIEAEIKQCNDYIDSLNKKDDSEYSIFSPRSASRVYKDQLSERKLKIEKLQFELRDAYKSLSSITKKLDSIEELDPSFMKKEVVNTSSDENFKLLKLQEDDRQRIASDLHDTVLQNLTLVTHNLELSSKFIDYDPIRAKLEIETNRKLVKEIIEEIRNAIFDLRPMQFEDFGFRKTLINMISEHEAKSSFVINYGIDDLDGFDSIFLLTTFRIVQELLVNSISHSDGNIIDIQVANKKSDIYISVCDNGKGFDINQDFDNHFGIKLIRDRVDILNGTFSFESNENGTKATIIIPVDR